MHVVVCVKQVPDSTNVRIDPRTNTLMREGVEAIVNPFDVYALEQGLRLKETRGARVIVISMGPPQAQAVLRDALARGADDAFLVSSRAFGGADTLATSYTLAQAIKKACGGSVPDVVLFGKQAIDGDTAQVGPGVSEYLDATLVTYVKKLDVASDGAFRAVTLADDGERTVTGACPAVFTVVKEADEPRFASLAGTLAAARASVTTLDEKAVEADPMRIGLTGSPTKVVQIFPPPAQGGGTKIDARGKTDEAVKALLEAIHG